VEDIVTATQASYGSDFISEAAEKERREQFRQGKGVQRRAGISDESVSSDKIQHYVRPVYAKDDVTKARIAETLKSNPKMQVLFGDLDGPTLQEMVDAFQVIEFNQGQEIIRQGDQGDRLYICGDGSVDVFVRRPGDAENVRGERVCNLGAGALFGELALMYQAPRAATVIIASPSCSCWALDREPFKMLLAQTGQAKLEMYEGFLKEVQLLKSLNHFELSKLSEALESQLFEGDEDIIRQGDAGETFFIVEDGTCSAFVDGAEVQKYQKGGYFGQFALLTDQPRKATVRATGQGCSVLACSREHFVNLLGPIQETLRNEYQAYVDAGLIAPAPMKPQVSGMS